MNLKFTLSNKLFLYYGILGFIIYSFISIIATFFDCGDDFLDLCKLEKDKINILRVLLFILMTYLQKIVF